MHLRTKILTQLCKTQNLFTCIKHLLKYLIDFLSKQGRNAKYHHVPLFVKVSLKGHVEQNRPRQHAQAHSKLFDVLDCSHR